MKTVIDGDQCPGGELQPDITVGHVDCPFCGHTIQTLPGAMNNYVHKHTPEGVLICPPSLSLKRTS